MNSDDYPLVLLMNKNFITTGAKTESFDEVFTHRFKKGHSLMSWFAKSGLSET